MIRGTEYTIRPFAFSWSGCGTSLRYFSDDAIIILNSLSLASNVNLPVTPHVSSPAISSNECLKIETSVLIIEGLKLKCVKM